MTSVLYPTYLKFREESLIDIDIRDRDKIFDFLSNACTTHPNEASKQTLISVYKQFLSLCPFDRKVPTDWDVEHNFKPLNPKIKKPDKAYDPAQHIYRTLTGEPLDTFSQFNVKLNSAWKHTTPDPARIPSLTSQDGVSYWNHYDLLGFILSLLKTDLDGATKDNFFLPLTVVYGRWCAKIGGDRKTPKTLKASEVEGQTPKNLV